MRFYSQKVRAHTLQFFFEKDSQQKNEDKFSEEGLKQRLAILIGKKNLSIYVGASDEMYDFIIYCISYGIFIRIKRDMVSL